MLRKTIFWIHLSCGVIAGLVILMMSVTGLLLTYERQLIELADKGAYYFSPTSQQSRLPLAELIENADQQHSFNADAVTVWSDPRAPVRLQAGRGQFLYVNPYVGSVYEPRSNSLDNFFRAVTGWHRWFNASGDGRQIGRAITGVCNLAFLFLVLSGIYLWLPRIYRWSAFKLRLWFSRSPTAAARDFNWHHVFGIWAAIPLIVIIASGSVFGYGWANNLVYQLVGEEAPQRGRGPGGSGGQGQHAGTNDGAARIQQTSDHLAPENFIEVAAEQVDRDWNSITLTLAESNAKTISLSIDQGNGGQPQKRHSITLDTTSGEVMAWAPFNSQTTGRQARTWLRFLHTGEALGFIGQTIAGLASFAAIIMVWTGLALALRRLQRYLKKKKAMKQALA